MITIQEVCTAILSGKFNEEDITRIKQAIQGRANIEQSEFKSTLREGQTVWFNNKTRPHYLVGQELLIIKINRERIVVKLKNPNTGGRFQGEIRSTVSLITTERPPYAQAVPKPLPREPFTITSKDVGPMPKL